MIPSSLGLKPREVLARKVFGGSGTGTVEAFPLWKPVLPATARPEQNLFAIASGATPVSYTHLTLPTIYPV